MRFAPVIALFIATLAFLRDAQADSACLDTQPCPAVLEGNCTQSRDGGIDGGPGPSFEGRSCRGVGRDDAGAETPAEDGVCGYIKCPFSCWNNTCVWSGYGPKPADDKLLCLGPVPSSIQTPCSDGESGCSLERCSVAMTSTYARRAALPSILLGIGATLLLLDRRRRRR